MPINIIRCADNRGFVTLFAADSLNTRPNDSVGDMPTVPGEPIVNAAHSGDGHMQRIYARSRG